jgi:hypothetical protein
MPKHRVLRYILNFERKYKKFFVPKLLIITLITLADEVLGNEGVGYL